MTRELLRVRGEPVLLHEDGSVSFVAGMTIDADGGRRTYAPAGSGLKGLDYLSNAGRPGNWYGLVCDPRGDPIIAPSGYYVSPTLYRHRHNGALRLASDPEAYLDPEKDFFMVFPGPLRHAVGPVLLGCAGTIMDLHTGKELKTVAGDSGPATHLGEASIACAEFFGVPSNPKWGGTDEKRFRYTFFTGVAAESYELQPV